MPDVPRCLECGTPLKAVPAWLATARVNFTCAACPRRSSRGVATRLEAPVDARATRVSDPELDLDTEEMEDLEEEGDLEMPADDLDEFKDEKDV